VLGGISVKVELAWVSVTGHFLLAIALIAVALLMHHRAGTAPGPRRDAVPRETMNLARAVYILTIWVLVAGTLVTAAGPHGGDAEAKRLGWALGDVARIHGISVDVLIVVTLILVVALVRAPAPRRALNVASVTIVVMAAQGVLGYVQYFNRIPPLLVGFHVFGAVCVFVCVQQLLFELRVPDEVVVPAEPHLSAPAGVATVP
jgi:cytochrome c oxidase assembly protein subunit 15